MKTEDLLSQIKIIAVDELPPKYCTRGSSIYQPLIDQFLALGKPLVRLEITWPKGTTNGEVQAIQNGLRSYALSRSIPVTVARREGEIYLRLDGDIPTIKAVLPPGVSKQPLLDALPEDKRGEFLDTAIEDLEVSTRTYNCLLNAEIRTVRQLVEKSESELHRIHSLGKKSLLEIRDVLRSGLEVRS